MGGEDEGNRPLSVCHQRGGRQGGRPARRRRSLHCRGWAVRGGLRTSGVRPVSLKVAGGQRGPRLFIAQQPFCSTRRRPSNLRNARKNVTPFARRFQKITAERANCISEAL